MADKQKSINYMDELANALVSNHAALMVGSGFSKNAQKVTNSKDTFMDWNELSDKLFESIYSEDQESEKNYKNTLRLAQDVEAELGRSKLEEILKAAIPDSEYEPSDLYIKLMEMPWRDIFTTNYDTLLERAAEKVTTRRYNVVIRQEDIVNSNDAPRIIKLHGSFPSQRPFIITEEDYRTYPYKFPAMVNTVQQALLENVFCMLGFSCEDPNFLNWIGWVHDILGEDNSQKIYMISVTHEPESAKRRLLNQNILVIDLEELWPLKSKTERIDSFIEELSKRLTERNDRERWFDINQLNLKINSNYEENTQCLKIINDSYPGWIFMPCKMKTKVDFIFQNLGWLNKFEKISYNEKINYMYEYVKFSEIAGRPLTLDIVERFWNALISDIKGNSEEDTNKELIYKKQIIYLCLLQSFRELADWEKYDICHEKIDNDILDYDSRQFLFVCDWWDSLYRFKPVNLKGILDQWTLASNDVYWILIKASFYALVGEIAIADKLLSDDLVEIRREILKSEKIEYLSSVEDCVVSLINFIRLGTNPKFEERQTYTSDVSWWEVNNQFCLNLKREEHEEKSYEIINNFNLSKTYKKYMGKEYTGNFCALEYLRFLEKTGHPFRLQNATFTNGLQSTIKILAPFYPHWCLMQMLIARDTEMIDMLFGRAKLANISLKDIDEIMGDYINDIQLIMKKVSPKNSLHTQSVYSHAAAVFPEIISRLCYKCSLKMLDKILNLMLKLCVSDVRSNFKGIDKVFKGLLSAYTEQEQEERLEKVLEFPMDYDVINHYRSPICYFRKPQKKYTINIIQYNHIISQLKIMIDSEEAVKQEGAMEYFIVLAQIINLRENDEDYLYGLLERKESLEDNSILYCLNPVKYSNKADEIFNDTMKKMQQDSKTSVFSANLSGYKDLVEVMGGLNIESVDIASAFSTMTGLIKTNIPWLESKPGEVDERIKDSFTIASGLLALRYKIKMGFSNEENKQINNYLTELTIYMPNMNIMTTLWASMGTDTHVSKDTFNRDLLMCEDKDFQYIICFYKELDKENYSISDNKDLVNYSIILFKITVGKVANYKIPDLLYPLRLCYWLLQNNICLETEIKTLLIALSKIKEITTINENDSEECALNKLNCRIDACEIAHELYIRGVESQIIDEWKSITEDENEFSELRNINFEDK